MNAVFSADRRALLRVARIVAATGLVVPTALLWAADHAKRPGGRVPDGASWAGGGPRVAPSAVAIVTADEPGDRMVLSGRVVAADGSAIAGMTIYVYQTDALGLYNPEGRYGAAHRIRGWACTDRNGRYEFATIRPGHYPGRSTPAHVHMTVCSDSMPEWWLPEVRFEGDPLISAEEHEASRRYGRFGNVRPLQRGGGVLRCTRDLLL